MEALSTIDTLVWYARLVLVIGDMYDEIHLQTGDIPISTDDVADLRKAFSRVV